MNMKSSFTKLALIASLLGAASALSAQSADGIFTKVDENPVPVRTVAPKASSDATGLVAVVCVIDEDGKVMQADVSKSTNGELDKSALEAVKGWSFKPAKKDGKAVKVRITIPMRFEGNA
ncbi:MAG: energy transducer TonB [Opitutae bacterium]|nr:energy transducer TonB [Opitutae bacterium]